MDQITYEMRLKNWEHVVEECNRRPEGVTVKQWFSENGINVKVYYYWLRRVRQAAYDQMKLEQSGELALTSDRRVSYLAYHVKKHQTKFNVMNGDYDYIVLQEHSHPFDRIDDYRSAVKMISSWADEAGSRIVIYGTWARKDDRASQEYMNNINRDIASENGAILAPVGERWWTYNDAWPDIEFYAVDGAHASRAGTEFAAKIIWTTIEVNLQNICAH